MITALGFMILLWAFAIVQIGFWWTLGMLFILLAAALTFIAAFITHARGIFYEHRKREHF